MPGINCQGCGILYTRVYSFNATLFCVVNKPLPNVFSASRNVLNIGGSGPVLAFMRSIFLFLTTAPKYPWPDCTFSKLSSSPNSSSLSALTISRRRYVEAVEDRMYFASMPAAYEEVALLSMTVLLLISSAPLSAIESTFKLL
jgi:hypothetical protein